METPGSSNYKGRHFDPNHAPWIRENQEKGKGKDKGKGKEKGKGKGKETLRSPLPWKNTLYDPDW